MKTKDKYHLLIAAALFIAWLLLVVCKVQGCEDLISYIKTSLSLVGVSHAVNKGRSLAAASRPEGAPQLSPAAAMVAATPDSPLAPPAP